MICQPVLQPCRSPCGIKQYSIKIPVLAIALFKVFGYRCNMLAERYIEALLANSMLADQIWEAWQSEKLSNDQAADAWTLLVANHPRQIVTQSVTRYKSEE